MDKKFAGLVFAGSLLAGALAWFMTVYVQNICESTAISSVLCIGLAFGFLTLLTGAAVLLCSKLSGSFEANVITGRINLKAALLTIVCGTVVATGLGCGFEWLYEKDFQKNKVVNVQSCDSYIFIVDDSGSMDSNDPNNDRYNAISEFLMKRDPDFSYAVYGFNENVKLVKDMVKVSEDLSIPETEAFGCTDILNALDRVISDIESGTLDCPGSTMALLLTDGRDDGFKKSDMNSVLDRFTEQGIVVNTMGFGNYSRRDMKHIAKYTGGISVDLKTGDKLSESIEEAVENTVISTGSGANRTLLSERDALQRSNNLLAFMRVIFIFILGGIITAVKLVCFGKPKGIKNFIIISLILSFLAGLSLELELYYSICTERFGILITWLLLAATLGTYFADTAEYEPHETGYFDIS